VGLLVIRLLKALAIPLILFAILDAFLRTSVSPRQGMRMIAISLVNVSVAFTIGLVILNLLRPGERWRGHVEELAAASTAAAKAPGTAEATLDPLKNLEGYVPKSLIEPFANNAVIPVVLLGILAGAALRRVREGPLAGGPGHVDVVAALIATTYHTLMQMLFWVVQAIPFAVFAVVAQVVGRSGLGVFRTLWVFLAVILLGLLLHALVYYPLVAWVVGGKSPRVLLGKGADAILTGLSINSSLATVPVTLRCLTEKMGVSERSARLSACVGTNLNNDGITLYDAMAALFIAQACGWDLSLGQQLQIVLASLMAGVGIAGIPEAGLIVLPLVLQSAGLPESVVAAAIPLVLPVDWIIARVRSGVNVMGDMVVAILLDRGEPPDAAAADAAA
jgi:DAACS family dicarboxylate/amino acid:cation (Na+ or H+) symporter